MFKADSLSTFICRLSWNVGAPNSWDPQGLSRPVQGLFYISHDIKLYLNRHCNPLVPATSTHPSTQWAAVTTQSVLMIEAPHLWEPSYSYDTWKINYERLYSKRILLYKRERSLACVAEIAVFMQYIFFSMPIYLSAAVHSFALSSAAYIHLGHTRCTCIEVR